MCIYFKMLKVKVPIIFSGTQGWTLEGVVDVILCPVAPGVAPLHNTAKYWGYTSQWNLLDYPALVFPVSKVDSGLDVVQKDYEPMNDVDRENWKLCEYYLLVWTLVLTINR